MKTLAILLGEHPCIVNILFGPMTVHYREVLLYFFCTMQIYRYCQLYFHNRAATVVLGGCVADRITNITQKCMHKINNSKNLWQ